MRRLCILATLAFGAGFGWPGVPPHRVDAQAAKPPITRADYGRFESLTGGGGRGGGSNSFSADGTWLAYGITRVSRSDELRLVRIADANAETVPYGSQATFSSDSKWVAYAVGHSPAETDRLTAAQRPVQNAIGIQNLATGETATVEGIQSFSFSPDGAYLAMHRYPPTPTGGASGADARGGGRGGAGRGGADAAETVGATVIVRQLATGRDTTFGNVSAVAWQDVEASHLLALTISADGHVGNGVQLFDPATTVLRVLESTPAIYTEPTWRHNAADLAVFRGKTDPAHDGPTQAVLAWTGIGQAERQLTYDPTNDASFPRGMRTVPYRRLSWSEDGRTIFLGIAKWNEALPAASRGRGAASEGSGRQSGAPAEGGLAPDEPAGVDIWHWQDVFVQPRQKLSAAADARRSLLAAWPLDGGTFVPLGHSFDESIDPLRHGHSAVVAEWSKYAMDRTIGRPAADMYLEDEATGVRTPIVSDVNDRGFEVGPAAKTAIFLRDDAFWAVNLDTRAITNITKGVATSFIDKESDETITQKPAFGVAGWTPNDRGVLLYDRYDIWLVPTDGSKAQRLTNGAADQIRHRLVRVTTADEAVDLAKPTYISLFGLLSKKSGYGRLGPGGTADRLVWLDKSVTGLARAKNAEVYSYVRQDYDDSPDIFVTGPDLKNAKQVTNTNAFQSNFAWGKSQTVDFTTATGMKLQGSLYYPAGYLAGRTYPMIVYLYERLSDNVHRYVVPSDRDYYNITVFMSQGYFVFEPDIVFHPRQPGLSVVECVTAGVKSVLSMGAVDGKRVGVVGHSWGGFDTAFLATHTDGVFAAAVAGAPITDLVSNYGNHHWSSGIAETDHIETGQQRMEVPLYEDLPDYVANSAVFHVSTMTVPLLIEVGDADGTVFWHQGLELFNIARRAKRNVVLLEYEGEDHGLRQPKNQVDYQQRILAWFGHYLKGDDAPQWITRGETYLDRQDEVKKATAGRGGGGGGL
jgi:dipeptidyl aminopeptidase/acylaminoacyl peptidase